MTDSEQVTLTIDGHQIRVPPGTLLIEAARRLGIEIPVYCYHPKLDPMGACRVCVVEVENQRRPMMTACTTRVSQGMVVHTQSEAALKARKGVLEFLLINHPLDCPVCDRGGECDLQDFTLRYGPPDSRFIEGKRHFAKAVPLGSGVILDRERCIMCMRCVRFAREIELDESITVIERGDRSEIGTFPGKFYESPFAGNIVEICPVGALTAEDYRFRARPWELQVYSAVCPGCAMGCNITIDVRYNDVVRLRSRMNDLIDDGWLCDRGRYCYRELYGDNRLRAPLIRVDDDWKEVSWDEAMEKAAAGLAGVPPRQRGAVAGWSVGNEAAWALMKLVRSTWKSPHLDHRHGMAWNTEKGDIFEAPLVLNGKVHALDEARAVVLIECDPRREAPVLELRIKKALRRGAELITVGECGEIAKRYARCRLAGDALTSVRELLTVQELETTVPDTTSLSPWEPGGVAFDNDPREAWRILGSSSKVMLICSERTLSQALYTALVQLSERIGCKSPFGIMQVMLGYNSRGLREMGVLPVCGPGWVNLRSCAERFGEYCWESGLEYEEILKECKALLIIADDPVGRGEALGESFVVACEHTLTATAKRADVILPLCAFAEETYSVTSFDGSVSISRQAVAPLGYGESTGARPALWIVSRLARLTASDEAAEWQKISPRRVLQEIITRNPLYQGKGYEELLRRPSDSWCYPQQGKLGTPRPDLSAMPVLIPQTAPWKNDKVKVGKVEQVARSAHNDRPPEVPGQDDPRLVAEALSLLGTEEEAEDSRIPDKVELAINPRGAQPPGPAPAYTYHKVGMTPRAVDALGILEATDREGGEGDV